LLNLILKILITTSLISALHMEYHGIRTIFMGKKIQDLRCWPDNCLELCQDLKGFQCDGKIIKLSSPDIYDIGFFFLEKCELVIGKRCMLEENSVLTGFFLDCFSTVLSR